MNWNACFAGRCGALGRVPGLGPRTHRAPGAPGAGGRTQDSERTGPGDRSASGSAWFGVAALAGLWLLTGCSSFRTEMGRPLPARAGTYPEGVTRVETVVRDLGPPNQVSRLPNGCVFLYEYSRMSEFQLGISVNYSFLRWFKFVKAWNRLNQEALVLTFDEGGVLRGRGLGQWNESLGGGTAVQLLFAAVSLSDISELLQPADAHSWGSQLLEDAPVLLNSGQTLRSGEHGVQQRIAPDYAGQHTLEMTQPKTEKQKKRLKKDYQWQPN